MPTEGCRYFNNLPTSLRTRLDFFRYFKGNFFNMISISTAALIEAFLVAGAELMSDFLTGVSNDINCLLEDEEEK